MPGRRLTETGLTLLLAFALIPASAGADPIGGGQTRVALSKQLGRAGIELRGVRPAKDRGRTATLPVSSGLLESTYGTGYLFLEGGIELRSGRRTVVMKDLLLNTAKEWLRGKIGGRKVFIATTAGKRARRPSFDSIGVRAGLRLTPRAARLLNRRLGTRGLFRRGRSLGSVSAVGRRDQLTVVGGAIRLAIDEGFRSKLESLAVEARSVESARQVATNPQTFELPNLRGFIAPSLSSGGIGSESGILLIREGMPGRQAFVWPMSVNLETRQLDSGMRLDPSPPLQEHFDQAPFPLAGLAPVVDRRSGEISAPETPATLGAAAAERLNEAFAPPGEPAFNAGEPFAAISFTAQTR